MKTEKGQEAKEKKREYVRENTCVLCGKVIPEGRLVCPNCYKRILDKEEED